MSTLSELRQEFIQYLYINNIKLETYERPSIDDTYIQGYWSFSDKDEKNRGFINICYRIDHRHIKVTFITSHKNTMIDDVTNVVYGVILYLFSIYSTNELHNQIDFDKFTYPFTYHCFLCTDLDKECELCRICKNNHINMIVEDRDILSIIKCILNPSSHFQLSFIRNVLFEKSILMSTQEFLDNRHNSIYGNIKLYNDENIINIDYTVCTTKKALHMTLKKITFTMDLLEMIILHLISGYFCRQRIEQIMIRFQKNNENVYNFLQKIGFNESCNEERNFNVIFNLVDLQEPSMIVKTNYKNVEKFIVT